jgi:hypothetical protein
MLKYIFAKIKHNHFLAMVLCCAIPLIAIIALSAIGVLGSWGYYALILLCPLGHIFMMRGMQPTSENSRIRQRIKHDENRMI